MQPAEAITRLIRLADKFDENTSFNARSDEEVEEDQVAVSIAQAMLNSMLPVARFRVFVRIESGDLVGAEYTVCCVEVRSVRAALEPLLRPARRVYIQLWEQRATGADMLTGFQGWTKSRLSLNNSLSKWLDSLSIYEPVAN